MNDLRQVGAFTISLNEQYKVMADESGMGNLIRELSSVGSVEMFCSTIVLNFRETPIITTQGIWGIGDDGSLTKIKYVLLQSKSDPWSGESIKAITLISNLVFETLLLSFTFANCSNVKLEDVTEELQPEPKIRRRLRLPEVKRYTLNIAGHVTRPSRDYDQGPQDVMPFHLCRGHFATYTADRPLFGNPKLVGRFWHPPHTRGKKANGEIIKDYAIQDKQ
jgi:hypothetical protein